MKTEKDQDLEALLILENTPVQDRVLQKLLDLNQEELDTLVKRKNAQYEKLPSLIRIVKREDRYELFMDETYQSPNIIGYLHKKRKLPGSILETLSIIAYKQPVTRIEVEEVRGVNCTNQIKTLLDEGLIVIEGRKDTVGKPLLLRTTDRFLSHFGIKSLKDLPPLEEIKTYAFFNESKNNEGED